jgi:HEAT repeat protein
LYSPNSLNPLAVCPARAPERSGGVEPANGIRGLSLLGDEAVTIPAVEAYKSATGRFGRQEALDALARLQTEHARAELIKLLNVENSWGRGG